MSWPAGWSRFAENVLVAKGYRLVQRDQQFLMPESMRDWLPESDPVWLVISVVAGLDTSGLHAKRRTGAAGRAGYDPDMLLTLLIWAWAQGIGSSRVIERLCGRDVAFRIICAGDVPDHVTISRFRVEAAGVMEELFAQVLMWWARLGMGQLGVVAIGSVKLASNASLSANRTEEGLGKAAAEQAAIDAERARELAAAAAAEHAGTDAAEDELYGPGRRGEVVPAELVDARSRAARIAQAREELKADTAARAAERDGVTARKHDREQRKGVRRQAKLDAYRRRRDEHGTAPMGKPPKEIRIEVLTENLAAVRARHRAKIDRYIAAGSKGRAPLPVEQNAKVNRVKAALDRAIAEQAAHEQASWPRPQTPITAQ